MIISRSCLLLALPWRFVNCLIQWKHSWNLARILLVLEDVLEDVFSVSLHVGESLRRNKAATDSSQSLIRFQIKYISSLSTVRLFAIATAKPPPRVFHWKFQESFENAPLSASSPPPHLNISISLRFFRATQKFRFILRNVALWLRDERTWHYLVEIKFSFRMELHSPTRKKWNEWIRRLLI